ncbi:MAG: hypothetical protein HY941_11995 [Gammaproteobacteria bacterium]|nr:hypothetical protein [Gammaproteobacteria bacterium]
MFTRIIAGWFILMMGCLTVQAQDTPVDYPRAFDLGGTLEAIDKEELMVTISDMQISVSANTRVHTLREKNLYLGALRVGQHVGVHFSNPGGSKPTASDIWVLENPQQLIPPPPGMH